MTSSRQIVCMDIKVKVIPNYLREFMQVALAIVKEGKEELGCLGYYLRQDMEEENIYNFETKWESETELDVHIASQNFGALMGALFFLGDSPEIIITNVSITGGNEYVYSIRNQSS